jgi:hypothetical protein
MLEFFPLGKRRWLPFFRWLLGVIRMSQPFNHVAYKEQTILAFLV